MQDSVLAVDATGQNGVSWLPDSELEGFEMQSVDVVARGEAYHATLVRAVDNPDLPGKAVLYVHGLTDYFFQAHMARAYLDAGFAFYALDLHGFGRSLREGDRPNYCDRIDEFFTEIDEAIERICGFGARQLVVNAHSTGGLILSHYADRGRYRERVDGLFLNSPFFDFPMYGPERWALHVLRWLGRFWPRYGYFRGKVTLYSQSIYRGYRGEWDYNLSLKPAEGFPIYLGWIRAIMAAQRSLKQGLNIRCPVLIMCSSRSIRAINEWTDELQSTDAVLDVEQIRRYGPGLGDNVSLVEIEGGMHDLVLSPEPARRKVFVELFRWLGQVLQR